MQNKWADGDEIISTPVTFVSTNHAILYENMLPRFADVDRYLCLDPESVSERINQKTRAVMFVGYGGSFGQLDRIIDICRENNLKLILDAAHMAGTRVNGVFPGTLPGIDAAVYSFQAVKNLPTADSGMVCFANGDNDAICRKMTWLGINKDTYTRTTQTSGGAYKWQYDVEYIGNKDHGNSIMAAIGIVQLKYLEQDNAYRRQICAWYDELLLKNTNVRPIPAPYPDECSRHLYVISVPDRDKLFTAFNNKGIFPGVHYKDNTEYGMYAYDYGKCPNAQTITKRILSLPLHLQITQSAVEHIASVINELEF